MQSSISLTLIQTVKQLSLGYQYTYLLISYIDKWMTLLFMNKY